MFKSYLKIYNYMKCMVNGRERYTYVYPISIIIIVFYIDRVYISLFSYIFNGLTLLIEIQRPVI